MSTSEWTRACLRSGNDVHGKRFLFAAVGAFFLCAVVVVALGVWLNPYGDFGPTGFHRLPNARYAKTAHIGRMPAGQRPQVYVLGSSNVMRYSAPTIERLSGKRGFDYGVFWGRSEDFYVIAKHFFDDLGERPELFVVGLDVWSFRPHEPGVGTPTFPGLDRRLVNTTTLSRHLDGYTPVKRAWASLTTRSRCTTSGRAFGRAGARRAGRIPTRCRRRSSACGAAASGT